MWEFITIFTGIVLLLSSSNLIRMGGVSLVSISVVNWAGGFNYLLSLPSGVVYLQLVGMALYALPLMFIRNDTHLGHREWITVLCFFTLMTLDGIYLINYEEEIINLVGLPDALINLVCLSSLILFNIRRGVRNGVLILSGVYRLLADNCDNTLLCTKNNKLLDKQTGNNRVCQ